MEATSIIEGFLKRAEVHPNKTSIFWKNERISYAETLQNVLKVAAFLKQNGVSSGDRVVFYGEKNPLFVYTYLAIHLVNAVSVPLDVKLPNDQVLKLIDQVEPSLVLHPIESNLHFNQKPFNEEIINSTDLLNDFTLPKSNDLADILFTTGTTGSSKGVQLTHKNILAGALNSNEFIGNDASDTEIIPLPLHHAFGLRRLRTNMFLGGSVVLLDGFMFPRLFFTAIEEFGATGLCMVPAGFSVIKKLMKDRYIPYFKKLKYIEFGSSPMNIEEKKELAEALPNTRICMHYGLTEVAANIFTEFHEAGEKINALGKPSPNTSISILDEEGKEAVIGEAGEIVVKGDIQTSGYWKNSSLTEQSFINGWFKTGDLGYKDEDGYIFLSGRKDDVINVGGKKVFPSEIEKSINQFPAIKDSVCVSLKNEGTLTGEQIVAFLVIEKGQELKTEELVQFLRSKLEAYKIPVEFKLIDAVPYTASGKKKRDKLK